MKKTEAQAAVCGGTAEQEMPGLAGAGELLLEIGTEEIPARFMPDILAQLKDKTEVLLAEEHLSWSTIRTMGTPRRLVLHICGLPEKQADREEKKKGPARERAMDREGRPTAAALGFAAKLGLTVDDLLWERSGKGEYLVAVQRLPGAATEELLAELLPRLIKSLSFPKNMYWEKSHFRFARPVRWLLCLLGDKLLQFECAGLQTSCETRGHRFLAAGTHVVKNPAHYFSLIPELGVILDQEERARLIREGVETAAASCGARAVLDSELLQEVTFLVEKPQVLLCTYPEQYLDLPRDVLVTTMQSHQRYFPLDDGKGRLRPFFVAVSNNPVAPAKTVLSGNEKVLKARLADARFFYDEDRRITLDARVEKLKVILFQEKLGTVHDKMERLVSLTAYIAANLPDLDGIVREAALRAARLAKADLATHMVGEFPELQGIMGREYALSDGEDANTATAIYEHYLPRFAGDEVPGSLAGAIVALADKADHLAGCFAAGIRPSGSQDPYALRRQSLGLLQICLAHALPMPLGALMVNALLLYRERLPDLHMEQAAAAIKEFVWQRLRHYLQDKGMDYDLVEAVLGTSTESVFVLWQRLLFLQEIRYSEELALTATAYTRVANLAVHADAQLVPQEMLFTEPGEQELHACWRKIDARVRERLAACDYAAVIAALAGFKQELDRFFDAVLVMVDDDKIRANRLALLYRIRETFLGMADFARIVFPSREG